MKRLNQYEGRGYFKSSPNNRDLLDLQGIEKLPDYLNH